MLDNKETELRSEEVQEILTRMPNALIRWGTTIVFCIVVLMLLLSWLIKYPDVISTQIVITTQSPPEKLIAKTSGKIEVILIDDKAKVNSNTPIAVIENAANYKDVFLLKSILDTISLSNSKFPFYKLKTAQLGEIENSFALFQKEYSASELNIELQPFEVESNAQNFESIRLNERLQLLVSQKNINQSELQLLKTDLERHENLFVKGVISAQEVDRNRLNYLQAEKNYKALLSSVSQLKSSINETSRASKTTKINESKENINLERNVIQSFYNLKNTLKEWELKYVLRSSINGTVSFLQVWSQNQMVNSGETIFTIIPNNSKNYIGKVKAVAQNSGKIKMGQTVNVRLMNFPDREFGVLKGVINNVALTPDKEGNILIDVVFPNGLTTTYKKQITFQQEMTGNADIVTSDLRILNRILYQLTVVVDN